MKKLARKLKKSQNDDLSLPTRDDPAPMDTQGHHHHHHLFYPSFPAHPIVNGFLFIFDFAEQEELVRSFEKSQAQQSRMWRALFASLLFCFAAFLMHSIHQQVSSPWELRFHAYFMEEMDSWMIISADWLAVVACSLAIKGLLHNSKHHRRWIWFSFLTGIIVAVFWLYYMLRLPRFHWDVIWLPFGPISGTGLSLYVDHLLLESLDEIRKLRGYMYAYKAS